MKREMLEFGTTVRVENGPARKHAIATRDLLDNAVTASHYFEGSRDAMGKIIQLGQQMTYLDYKGTWVWYVYQYDAGEEKWLPVTIESTREAAITAAEALQE
jgi:hypothetical protein